ncbi:hypothetical protein ABZ379_42565 [Streptomyces canus]|uniref:hypothetical protein n=1 Tax=Streptomyces canus TaxID=58343 RepID=UPI0033E86768
MDRENERLIRGKTSQPVARLVTDYERRLRREAHAREHGDEAGCTATTVTTDDRSQ